MLSEKLKKGYQKSLEAELTPERLKTFPKTYRGYPVSELLQMWKDLIFTKIADDTPKDKIAAMDDFLREFKLGVHKYEV